MGLLRSLAEGFELAAHDLAGGVAGQGLEHADFLGDLEPGDQGLEVVEDVVFSEDELKEDDTHWPYVRLVGLFGIVQDGLHWHV